jgi:hypothetical protein
MKASYNLKDSILAGCSARLAFFEQSMRDADRLNAEFQLAK